jgi:hypothetical protein
MIREIYYNHLLAKKKSIAALFKFGLEVQKLPDKK